ncbi:molybdopterin-guanine dinucleotide biosynthesis protein B [Paenibacillus turpanensis]|uniref:molybdopterin-guanine dinucleotide biosynthesis protein B n=1 Tax=Paenibacillus turpanensis TaxID=2689078 RepID=UPI00140D3AAD|nr:molybdopterin-guanine dinucleotide biosynthesis protein B [Paenibacillus turpanensis]
MGQKPVVIQVVGYKNSGKTTLVCALIERLAAGGLKVGTIKHDAHDFEPDVPDTDSWRHRQAGAQRSAITSPGQTAYYERRGSTLDELLNQMRGLDIVLVEGFKQEGHPKLVLLRSKEDLELLGALNHIIAAVTVTKELLPSLEHEPYLVFMRSQQEAIAACVLHYIQQQ